MWKVFLTGATGFLGGELAVTLSNMEAVDKLVCLVRAGSDEDGLRRLQDVFALHNNNLDLRKVRVVAGNLADDRLCAQLTRNANASDCNIVLHTAANTSFLTRKNAAIHET